MTTKTDFASVNDVAFEKNGYSNYIYLKDRDENNLIKQLNEIKGVKTVVAAYGQNNRHYMLVHVDQKIKKVKKTKKE